MPFKHLTPTLSVSPQLSVADVAEAAKEGFRAIIDNRPDGEEGGQISAAEMEKLAADQSMGFAHIPVVSGSVDDESVEKMADALDRLDGPVLAYCRTGTRSATLWALTQSGSADPDDILSITRDAGYDLTQLKPRLKPPAA
jgi:sulfide:quinone oxidoreductase